MSSQVKKKAAEADEWIRQQAEAAQAADPDAPSDDSVVATVDGDTAEPPVLEAVPQITSDHNEQPPVDGELDWEQQLVDVQAQAEKSDQRWRSLQGQIGSKDRQIEQLHELLGNIQKAPPVAEEPPPAAIGYTTGDVDAFGEDMMDVIERVARQVVQQSIGELKRTVEGLTNEVNTVSTYTAQTVAASFDDKLDKLVKGDWRKLDTDDGFNDWLDLTPRRRQLMSSMASTKDAEGVAEFFNQYIAAAGIAEVEAGAPQRKRAAQLEKQIAPGKSRNTAPPAKSSPEERIWFGSEVAAVYTDWQRKVIDAEEFQALEKQIAKAMKANRVDYSK